CFFKEEEQIISEGHSQKTSPTEFFLFLDVMGD
ncbi:MAG: hypothetical protein ACI90V_004521, partial [Bacillariaceae sp.]